MSPQILLSFARAVDVVVGWAQMEHFAVAPM